MWGSDAGGGGFGGGGGSSGGLDEAARRIQEFVVVINQMRGMVEALGTKKDDRKLRKDLTDLSTNGNTLIRQVRDLLAQRVDEHDPSAKAKSNKLKTQFMDSLEQFNKLSTQRVKKEREIVQLLESGNYSGGPAGGDPDVNAQQFELQEIGLQEADVNLIALNNMEVEQLTKDLEALNELFHDVHEEIYNQAEPLEQVEANVQRINDRIVATNRELKKSYAMQTMAWTSMFFIGFLLVVLGALCVVVCLVVCGMFCFVITVSVIIPAVLALLAAVVVPIVIALINK